MRTITISFETNGGYTVKEDDRYCDQLNWDEMLSTVCHLTHPKLGEPVYAMRTKAEWDEREEIFLKRVRERQNEENKEGQQEAEAGAGNREAAPGANQRIGNG